MKRLLPLLALVSILFSSSQSRAAETDLTPVKKWVERTAKLKSFSANFLQRRYLKTVRKPLESTGTIQFVAPESFRWQAGNPATLIATAKTGGDLTIQRPQKKEAEVITHQQLQEKADGQGISLLESGFPRSFEEFQKKFEILSLTKSETTWSLEVKLAQASNAVVRKIVILFQDGSFTLSGLQLFFRDGSRIESYFTESKENPTLGKELFVPDLTGYAVKKGG